MTETSKNLFFQAALLVVVVFLLGWYISVSCDYPYYFVWDMDCVTAVDSVLIQSGQLPDHIHHTGFGMYLVTFFTEKVAHFSGALSAIKLEELADSLNPLASMAELTAFLRLHSPFLAVGIVGLLLAVIYLTFGMPRVFLLLAIIFLGTQESLTYQSAMIRTELWSVFFWSAALLSAVISAKSTKNITRFLALFITGIFAGLSFLTKVQSLIYIIALVCVFVLVHLFNEGSQERDSNEPISKYIYCVPVLSLANMLIFFFVGLGANAVEVPGNIPTWSSNYAVTKIAVLFFSTLTGLFLIQLFGVLSKKVHSSLFKISCAFSVIAFGFLLAFGLHFLVYSDMSMSLFYMLLNFKMTFLRVSYVFEFKDFGSYFSDFLLFLRYNPAVFIVNVLLLSLLIIGYFLRIVRITKGQILLCLFINVLALINILIATRFSLRDLLWKEVLINFVNLLYFAILLTRTTRHKPVFLSIAGVLLVALTLVNFAHSKNVPDRIDANYNHYGWRSDKWLTGHYKNNQRNYKRVMVQNYTNDNIGIAMQKARQHRQIKRTVRFVFKNQALTHRNIGIAFEGFGVWASSGDYRIAKMPADLRGAILVDNGSVETERSTFFESEYVLEQSEYLDKFQEPSSKNQLSILSRRDLRIFLFVSGDDATNLTAVGLTPTAYTIIVKNADQSVRLNGLEVNNYCQLPLDKITQKFFFVISQI